MAHRPRIDPVPVPAWTLHWPRCDCGWDGDVVRTRRFADDQVDEHLAETAEADTTYQPSLF